MYREGADPNVTEVLHTLDVSTSKGANVVGLLVAISILFVVALAVTVFMGAPPEIEGQEWPMVALAVVFGVLAYAAQRRRRRELRILRHGDAVKLVMPAAGIELDFPLECRGTQFTMHMRGVPVHEVFLQIVDGRRRGVVLHEVRGAIHGRQEDWPDDIDRSVTSASFDVGGAGTLARVRSWIERLSLRRGPT